jgi:hypothetical protein
VWITSDKWQIALKDVPGYQLTGSDQAYTLNIPKLGRAVFNMRTGN